MSNERPTIRTSPRELAAIALIFTILALGVYRPWISRPFDTLDFSEFLPFLNSDGGPWAHLKGMLGYYVAGQGRLNVLSYIGLVAKWTLFGDHTEWWRWLRVAELMAIVGMIYVLFRRLNSTILGAAAGASLFICSRLSGESWTRLTMGEPLGIALMVGAMLLACGWRDDPSRRRGVAMALLVAGSILAKETLVGLVPLVWLIAAIRNSAGRLDTISSRSDAARLLAWIGLPAIATFGAAAYVALTAHREGFTTLYGSTHPTIGSFVESLQRPWQIQGLQGLPASWVLPANTLLALLTIGGGVLAFRESAAERRHLLWAAATALVLAVAYALLYLPWPILYLYYAMPFLLGPAFLFAVAMSAAERQSILAGKVARIGWAMLVAAALTSTERATSGAIAVEAVTGELTKALTFHRDADSIIVARSQPPLYGWIGTGPRLRRYILATRLAPDMPPVVDRLCPESLTLELHRPPRVVLVSYDHWCGPFEAPTLRFERTDRYLAVTWNAIDAGVDTFGVELLAPPAP